MEQEKVKYLDNNATTKVAPEVMEAMLPFLQDQYGNPSSIHRFGGKIRKHVDKAREQVAALIGAKPQEIYFTSCGSESDNTALQGFLREHKSVTRLITSSVEHPAVLNACRYLSKEGASVTELDVHENGLLREDQLEQTSIDQDTLVSLMWANNETGVIFDIPKYASKVKENGGWFHTDAVQAVGKLPVNVAEIPIDFLALSGHKLHAPKGVGALYVRSKTPSAPLIIGGHQEQGMRAGTENVAYIVGLGVACELAMKWIEEEQGRVRKLRDTLEEALLSECPGAKLNGHKDHRLPNTTNVSFEYIEGEAILLMLDEKNIAASSGSACTTGSLEPSHVMRAMGVPYTLAHSSTRFSLSRYTTKEDIKAVIEAMPPIVKRLRQLSPFVK